MSNKSWQPLLASQPGSRTDSRSGSMATKYKYRTLFTWPNKIFRNRLHFFPNIKQKASRFWRSSRSRRQVVVQRKCSREYLEWCYPNTASNLAKHFRREDRKADVTKKRKDINSYLLVSWQSWMIKLHQDFAQTTSWERVLAFWPPRSNLFPLPPEIERPTCIIDTLIYIMRIEVVYIARYKIISTYEIYTLNLQQKQKIIIITIIMAVIIIPSSSSSSSSSSLSS